MTLLINSDGIVGANPEMELPTLYVTVNNWEVARDDLDFQLKLFWQGFVPFEDQEKAGLIVHFALYSEGGFPKETKPNSIIEADIEYEVVKQERIAGNEQNPWIDYKSGMIGGAVYRDGRKVLRLKN